MQTKLMALCFFNKRNRDGCACVVFQNFDNVFSSANRLIPQNFVSVFRQMADDKRGSVELSELVCKKYVVYIVPINDGLMNKKVAWPWLSYKSIYVAYYFNKVIVSDRMFIENQIKINVWFIYFNNCRKDMLLFLWYQNTIILTRCVKHSVKINK